MKYVRYSSIGLCVISVFASLFLARASAAQPGSLESELVDLCENEPLACDQLFRDLISDGVIDQDLDGVLNLADQCPGTPKVISRAQFLLLEQELALGEAMEVFQQVRLLILIGANGTLDSTARQALMAELVVQFERLLDIANSKARGKFLFAGQNTQHAPFRAVGAWGTVFTPHPFYFGDHEVLELPIGTSGELFAISIPGDLLFLGGVGPIFPDPGASYVFGVVLGAYRALGYNDLVALLGLIDAVEDASAQIGNFRDHNAYLYSLTVQTSGDPVNSVVDANGCTREQFCSAIRVQSRRGAQVCERSDFGNDEPLRFHPRDCQLMRRARRDGRRCVAR